MTKRIRSAILSLCNSTNYKGLVIILITLFTGVFSHGTGYRVIEINRSVRIQALFDSGEPMSNAEVLVFSPGASKPVDTLRSDSSGIFVFSPDNIDTVSGKWVLQVRDKGGHGLRINYDVPDEGSLTAGISSADSSIPNPLRMWICAACVVWGFIGTALYFKRRA